MWRLSRRRPPRDERGAVVVLMAAGLVAIVAIAAMVVDVGSLLDERRQLQNGADAAALGVAQYIGQTCGGGAPACPASTLLSTAQSLASANARDGYTKVNASDVIADYANKRVTVKTSTLQKSGTTILPYWFGQALSGVKGKSVRASASARWDGLKKAAVIPLVMSKCEFDAATAPNNSVFNVQRTVLFHTKATTNCTGPSGQDVPGGYGWVKDTDSNPNDCGVTPTVNDTLLDDTGVPGTPHSCDMSTLLNKDVLLGVYDYTVKLSGADAYHVYGFGMFHLTGYRFSSSNVGGTGGCASPNTCISGYFIRFVGIGEYGGPTLGNRVALVS